MVPPDAARLQGLSVWAAEPGLLLGCDGPQLDEPHAEGLGARAAAAARDPVHAEPCVTLHCHDLECSNQLSGLCCHFTGEPVLALQLVSVCSALMVQGNAIAVALTDFLHTLIVWSAKCHCQKSLEVATASQRHICLCEL